MGAPEVSSEKVPQRLSRNQSKIFIAALEALHHPKSTLANSGCSSLILLIFNTAHLLSLIMRGMVTKS
jgi:hypothetical protein